MQWSMSDTWINPRLGAWISSLLSEAGAPPPGEIAVTFGPAGPDGGPAAQAGRKKQGINLYLLGIAPHAQAAARAERRTESQLVLRYLVTGWAEESERSDALLCALAFHLLGRGAGGPDGRSEVVIEPAPLEVLAALGLPPRPALTMGLPLVHVEVAEPARRVAHPPIVRAEAAATLRGILLGPDDLPIAAARVELPAVGRSAETDPAGRFRIAGVPANLADRTLRVRARGIERSFRLSAGNDGEPLILRMSFAEEG